MKRPRVHLYTISWNELSMLDYFFRHYDPWVERYVFYDNGSTDGTREYLERHPKVELRHFRQSVPGSFVLSAQQLQNSFWQDSRHQADWVVVTAVDEHLYHPDMPGYLKRCAAAGVTAVPALGYQMVAEEFPLPDARLTDCLRQGVPFAQMNKLSLFQPDALSETGFGVGRHLSVPLGQVRYPERDELLLLHYKYIGRDSTKARQVQLAGGLGPVDRANNWGVQYFRTDQAYNTEFDLLLAQAADIMAPGLDPHSAHVQPRWWRQPSWCRQPAAAPEPEPEAPPPPPPKQHWQRWVPQ